MKILVLTQKFSGCGYHRLMLPVSFMEKEYGRITDHMTEENWEEIRPDIVYINRTWDKDNLFELRKKYGFKLVVDVDDYWFLNADHLMYDNYYANNYPAKLIEHMRESDLVTCTHERLSDAISSHNKNILITPNAIPYNQSQFNGERIKTDAIKLFWAGGITHEQDMKTIQGAMHEISKENLNIQMVMGGYADSNQTERYYWRKMASYFTADQKIPYTLIRGMEVDKYYDLFRHGDIMLVPLVKNNFNSFKSNIKILEAAGKAMPAIVSAVHPYLGFPDDVVSYSRGRADYVSHIKKLVNDEALRHEQGAKLLAYCAKNYNFKEINEIRRNAFLSLIP